MIFHSVDYTAIYDFPSRNSNYFIGFVYHYELKNLKFVFQTEVLPAHDGFVYLTL